MCHLSKSSAPGPEPGWRPFESSAQLQTRRVKRLHQHVAAPQERRSCGVLPQAALGSNHVSCHGACSVLRLLLRSLGGRAKTYFLSPKHDVLPCWRRGPTIGKSPVPKYPTNMTIGGFLKRATSPLIILKKCFFCFQTKKSISFFILAALPLLHMPRREVIVQTPVRRSDVRRETAVRRATLVRRS